FVSMARMPLLNVRADTCFQFIDALSRGNSRPEKCFMNVFRCVSAGTAPVVMGSTRFDLRSHACISIKLAARRRLVRSHSSDHNLGASVAFGANGDARRTPQHRDLTDMSERVGQGTLDQQFCGLAEWS